MAVFPARKHSALFSLHCCLHLCHCVVLHVTCPHDDNVTCIYGITPQDARRKQKYCQLLGQAGLRHKVHRLGSSRA